MIKTAPRGGFAIDKLHIRNKKDDVLCLTMQDRAQTFKGVHRNRFVVLQIVNGSGIDTMFINQSIGGFSLFFHCFP